MGKSRPASGDLEEHSTGLPEVDRFEVLTVLLWRELESTIVELFAPFQLCLLAGRTERYMVDGSDALPPLRCVRALTNINDRRPLAGCLVSCPIFVLLGWFVSQDFEDPFCLFGVEGSVKLSSGSRTR